ncbi:response regulator [Gemmatimonas sp.]|uniref:ATP-binding response regulator n=1 Tax=Gemmatimonas sp. TaxID=1962908 RepID=UPI003569C6D3
MLHHGDAPAPVLLVADDDPISRQVLRDVLRPLGATLVFAHDGEEALRLAEHFAPDLVLLDVMMPVLNGFETAERLRGDLAIGDVPIILLSACNSREHRLRGLAAGADDFIAKPFDREELRARVSTACRLGRARRDVGRRRQFEQLVSQAPDGIVLLDDTTRVVFANKAMRAWLTPLPDPMRLATAAWEGVPFADLVVAQEQGTVRELLTSLTTTPGAVVRFEAMLRGLPTVSVEINASSAMSGDRLSCTLVVRDIRGRPTSAQHASLSGAFGSLGRLAAEVTHDVAGLLAVVQDCLLSVAAREGAPLRELTAAQSATSRATRLTRSLLRYGRYSAGIRERIAVEPFLQTQAAFLTNILPAHVMLDVDVAPDLPTVLIDVAQLEQALLNLVLNARNALGGKGRITVSATLEAGGVALAVADDGPGLAPYVAARLGQPYVTTRHETGGTGLGITAVRRCAESHGGTLRVEEEHSPGAKFVLWLPASEPVV